MQITYIDFLMYELMDINSHLEPTILDDVPSLKAYHDRIKNLPAIAAYMKSDRFLAYPLNAPFAAFGGQWLKKKSLIYIFIPFPVFMLTHLT